MVAYGSPFREKRSSNTVEFFMTEAQYQINRNATEQSLDTIRESSQRAFGYLPTCPSELKTDPNLPVNAKSTCPWYYEVDHNTSRYPAVILKAVTPCTDTCIYGNDDLQCLPVVRTIKTMTERGHDVSGDIKYETTEEPITVGFTCGARYMASDDDFYDQR